jgi:hypothetical protein
MNRSRIFSDLGHLQKCGLPDRQVDGVSAPQQLLQLDGCIDEVRSNQQPPDYQLGRLIILTRRVPNDKAESDDT